MRTSKKVQEQEKKKEQDRTVRAKKIFLTMYESTMCNISQSCKKAEISRRTYHNWINADEDFKTAVEDLLESRLDFAETQLAINIKKGKEASLIFFLKCKGKRRGYIEKEDIDSSEKDEFADMSDEELEEELEKLRSEDKSQ